MEIRPCSTKRGNYPTLCGSTKGTASPAAVVVPTKMPRVHLTAKEGGAPCQSGWPTQKGGVFSLPWTGLNGRLPPADKLIGALTIR